jgi:hypothetical protein
LGTATDRKNSQCYFLIWECFIFPQMFISILLKVSSKTIWGVKSLLKLVENTEIICHFAFTFYWIVAYLVRFYMHAAIILWIQFCIITWWQNLFILMNKLLFVLCYLWHKNKHKGMQIPIMPTHVLRYNTINIYIIINVVINRK